MVAGFTEETGIKVELRNGSDSELANQIVQEGDASPADVFLTENSPGDDARRRRRAASPRSTQATLAQVPTQYRPSTGDWVGFAARSTVLRLQPETSPRPSCRRRSWIWPTRRGRARSAIAPAGADFQAIVSAVLAAQGRGRHRTLAEGAEDGNAEVYQGNTAVMKAVNDGRDPGRRSSTTTTGTGPGRVRREQRQRQAALLRQPGPGRVRQRLRAPACSPSSKHPKEAQQFVELPDQHARASRCWPTARAGVRRRAAASPRQPALPPLAELDAPDGRPGRSTARRSSS